MSLDFQLIYQRSALIGLIGAKLIRKKSFTWFIPFWFRLGRKKCLRVKKIPWRNLSVAKKNIRKTKKGATQKLNIPTKDKLEMNPTQIASLRGSELSGRTSSDAYLRIWRGPRGIQKSLGRTGETSFVSAVDILRPVLKMFGFGLVSSFRKIVFSWRIGARTLAPSVRKVGALPILPSH